MNFLEELEQEAERHWHKHDTAELIERLVSIKELMDNQAEQERINQLLERAMHLYERLART